MAFDVVNLASSEALPAGKGTLVVDFAYDGSGVGKAGAGILSASGREDAKGRVEPFHARIFSADETAEIGMDEATPLVDGLGEGADTRFNGTNNTVKAEIR